MRSKSTIASYSCALFARCRDPPTLLFFADVLLNCQLQLVCCGYLLRCHDDNILTALSQCMRESEILMKLGNHKRALAATCANQAGFRVATFFTLAGVRFYNGVRFIFKRLGACTVRAVEMSYKSPLQTGTAVRQ